MQHPFTIDTDRLDFKDISSDRRPCKTVYDTAVKRLGYDVTYRLDGRQDVVRMDFDPGERIPVKDGKLVLDPPAKY